MVLHYSTLHGMSNRDDYRIVQWNSSGPSFHLKVDFFYVYTMMLDLILYWKTRNCQKVIFLNLKMFLCAWWHFFFCYHKIHSIIQNLFQKVNIFKAECSSSEFEIVSDIKLSVQHQFLQPWSCCFFFKLSKYTNVVVLLLLIFSCFLWPPMPLWLVE